jgi:hypothetical protein
MHVFPLGNRALRSFRIFTEFDKLTVTAGNCNG